MGSFINIRSPRGSETEERNTTEWWQMENIPGRHTQSRVLHPTQSQYAYEAGRIAALYPAVIICHIYKTANPAVLSPSDHEVWKWMQNEG